MNRERIDSSSIRSVGYDPDAKILEVEFRGGGVYQYFDVPKNVYEDLINASSAGRYYAVYIKNEFR
ncbi:MAG: KTSC domain-containing protein, partial [Saprospiraceae bacterium]|nr:KTSC domain-containing protein [Pyrinomonadaceae bacterium]